MVLRDDVGLVLPGLLGGVGLEIDVDAVVGPVVGALLQDHRQEEEGDGVVAGQQEAGLRDAALVVVLRGLDRVVDQLLPGRRLCLSPRPPRGCAGLTSMQPFSRLYSFGMP